MTNPPTMDRPFLEVGRYRTEVIVIVHSDHTEIRRPDIDEPLILRPGQQMRFGFMAGVTAEGYIEGIGWETDGPG